MFYATLTGFTDLHRAAQRGDELQVSQLLEEVRCCSVFFCLLITFRRIAHGFLSKNDDQYYRVVSNYYFPFTVVFSII